MPPTVYLLTGANRGIGLAIASQLAARPDAIFFAGARDPARATELQALAAAHPDRVHIIKVVSADKANNTAAVEEIKRVAGRLDVVIANAGISDCFTASCKTIDAPCEDAVEPAWLLRAHTNQPEISRRWHDDQPTALRVLMYKQRADARLLPLAETRRGAPGVISRVGSGVGEGAGGVYRFATSCKPALELPPEEVLRHAEVNTNGPLVLFQATYALLREGAAPKFVTMTSGIGSIAAGTELPLVSTYAYGASKAALNWVTRKLHHDFPDLTIFPINPGGVATDLSHATLEQDPGMKDMMKAFSLITAEESARGILEQVDVATRETHGGQFVDYSGLGKWPW